MPIPKTKVSYYDSASLDAFARLRVANPDTQFDSQQQYEVDEYWSWLTHTSGGASVTHLPDEASAQLSVGTASGDIAVRQTRRYFRYRPGKSQLILLTGVLGTATENVEQSFGYGDEENGVFLKQKEDGLYLVLRSKSSGTVVDHEVPQANWSHDPCDGTGESLISLNPEEANILAIDMEWLGVGRVRCYKWHNGMPILLHTWFNQGVDRPYTTTANLPVRYEIKNTAESAGASMKSICCSVISEGGQAVETGRIHSTGNGVVTRSAPSGSQLAVLSIRPKLTYNSITNRALVVPLAASLYVDGNADVHWELVYDATLGGSPTWSSAEADSLVEFSVNATTVSDKHVLASGYGSSAKGGSDPIQLSFSDLGINTFALTLNYDGTVADTITLAVQGIGGAATVAATLTWAEVK